MTTATVEALSLASLTALLSQPPQYPRNPTHKSHQPLVLYIVRVPGSRDVVLTPLKPPTKASISLDAIQTSLYYLHVETADDEVVKQSLEAERRASDENRPPPVPIQRKPLPPTSFANYPPSRRPPTPPKSYPDFQPAGDNSNKQYDRYAARGSHVRLGVDTTAKQSKPRGARPMPSTGVAYHDNQSPRDAVDESANIPTKLQIPEQPPSFDAATLSALTRQESPSSPSPDIIPSHFTKLTLIRRDPTSGAQWNVGSIRVGTRRHHLSPLQPVEVTLTSPGYTRFAQMPDTASPVKRASFDLLRSPSPPRGNPFWRYVGFRTVADEKTSLQDVRVSSNEFSEQSKGSSNKKPRQVYSFTSPWQGMCIFSNGVDGKSLRLRHSLPTNSNAIGEQGAGVAELRLNLPWSILRAREANRQSASEPEKLPISELIGKSKKEQFRRSMQMLKHDSKHLLRELREGKSSGDDNAVERKLPSGAELVDENYRLSLKLGREKAGGGFKGDSAKLGKLILEDEGLKMGDLVVASCMGCWWQHYHDTVQ
ncbi:uncharacterized protein HMPREF1541_03319 [Cyphellophora europaea CBS 101466]|uniref:Oxidoreductase-like protein n=1 Tax=Cyphellophora europaea (strain CBS 101466) TaxID=1220924 RepID=W2S0D8_CYPE1|nr:uncharacterized protein HMPREF1541_03319 [Cyphellophora europaea CBS 101466]ETN41384.1 hypothetical protein HMPREF1541_03319 [Cyphellophora europaea CBS 101466]